MIIVMIDDEYDNDDTKIETEIGFCMLRYPKPMWVSEGEAGCKESRNPERL